MAREWFSIPQMPRSRQNSWRHWDLATARYVWPRHSTVNRDDQTKLGAPTDFEVQEEILKISAGAGFIVALTGESL